MADSPASYAARPSSADRALRAVLVLTAGAWIVAAVAVPARGFANDPRLLGEQVGAAIVALVVAWRGPVWLRAGVAIAQSVAGWVAFAGWHTSAPLPQVDVVNPLGIDGMALFGPAAVLVLAGVARPALFGRHRWFCRLVLLVALGVGAAGAGVRQTYRDDIIDAVPLGAQVAVLDHGQVAYRRWDREVAPGKVPLLWTPSRIHEEWNLGQVAAGMGASMQPERNGLRGALWAVQRGAVWLTLWGWGASAVLAVPILLFAFVLRPAWPRFREALAAVPMIVAFVPWVANGGLLLPSLALIEAKGSIGKAALEVAVGLLVAGLPFASSRALSENQA